MRLWSKLLAILAVAVSLQACIDARADWLDESWFTLRVLVHNLTPGADAHDPEIDAAATRLWTRHSARWQRQIRAAAAAPAPRR